MRLASLYLLPILLLLAACRPEPQALPDLQPYDPDYAERFADLRVIQYDVPGFEQLTLQQKKLVYYLAQSVLAGRDVYYDQNYKHNLRIRKTLEAILEHYGGDREGADWEAFLTYAKRFFFSNGVHHHYGEAKFLLTCPQTYFGDLVRSVPAEFLPLDGGLTPEGLVELLQPILYDPDVDARRVVKTEGVDLVQASAVNFYEGVTQAEVEAYYAAARAADPNPEQAVSHGLNSRVVKLSGSPSYAYRTADGIPATPPGPGDLVEYPWCVGGEFHPTGLPCLYHEAIEEMVGWLRKAADVAENPAQQQALELLIEYYQTGDLAAWDAFNIAWVNSTEGDIDFIHGFVENYSDPLGIKAYYEGIIQMTDREASVRIQALAKEAQWFEDASPLIEEHKKANVTGISARVITVAQEGGGTAPNTPIGVNLPNADWIRSSQGSKSVSLDNIVDAYDRAAGRGVLDEFAWDEEEIRLGTEHGALAGKLHTDLHEVVGHASGQINPGVGTPAETLKNYANTLEEARADAFALYYAMDSKLEELGLVTTSDVGKAEYARYIRNGLMLQLRRVEPGHDIEEDHMRNRQLIAAWAYEMGKEGNVIERRERDGKTFFVITDYPALRALFGQQLRELQRIKSEGDFEAGRALVESYGVKVDPALHAEVLERYARLDIPPFTGFIQPQLIPIEQDGEMVDVLVSYPDDFVAQMLDYGKRFAFLPVP